ncbi:hypothetical protein ABZX85_23120 [Streptomyces sp. NPDC004539]|uniref:hypothetical protein n=1 Tax=Streptomyces sp. NPDC004539 TaxID=3154280 RepID=UPI0033A54948
MKAVTPSTDAERVLGQIERGEVRCGPAAAREIAARHETQYGAAFTTTTEPRTCAECGEPMDGDGAYCSTRCRNAADPHHAPGEESK